MIITSIKHDCLIRVLEYLSHFYWASYFLAPPSKLYCTLCPLKVTLFLCNDPFSNIDMPHYISTALVEYQKFKGFPETPGSPSLYPSVCQKYGCNYEIKGVLLSISNINSVINPDLIPKKDAGGGQETKN